MALRQESEGDSVAQTDCATMKSVSFQSMQTASRWHAFVDRQSVQAVKYAV